MGGKMSFKKITAIFFSCFLASGCCFEATRSIQAVKTSTTPAIEHFIPAPAMPAPRRPSPAEMFGQASNAAFEGPAAQTFTAVQSGTLSEIDLGTQGQSVAHDAAPPDPIIIEIRSTRNGLPAMGTDPIRLRGSIAYELLPPAARMTGGMIRLDISPQHVRVDKGEQLAIIQYYHSAKDPIQFQTVYGQPYKGGNLYQMNQGEWRAIPAVGELQFRVYVMQELEHSVATKVDATTAPAVPLLKSNQMPAGSVLAECLPLERTAAAAPVRPTVSGKWQFRAHVFNEKGSYYVELITYNGTNKRGFSYPGPNRPRSITLTRVGDASGKVVFPVYTNSGMNDYQEMQQQQFLPLPGEGTVHEYKLSDVTEPLPAGNYIVSIVPPEYESSESITVAFEVP
jgi:hypothetical protein